MAAKYDGRVNFVNENFGQSKLAEKYGVAGYPAVFVDDVLVARPRDFGFPTKEGAGRYAPFLKNAANQEKFKTDLKRMIDLALAGKKDELTKEWGSAVGVSDQIAELPQLSLTDLSGNPLSAEQVKGRVVVVEFWATWCPPCRSTLQWLGTLKQKYGDNVAVVGMAVESPEEKVRDTVKALSPEIRWAIPDAHTRSAFGDVSAIPTLYLFDQNGKTARVLYGAPPDLHEQTEKTIENLLKTEQRGE